jgi:hypothetical protein
MFHKKPKVDNSSQFTAAGAAERRDLAERGRERKREEERGRETSGSLGIAMRHPDILRFRADSDCMYGKVA